MNLNETDMSFPNNTLESTASLTNHMFSVTYLWKILKACLVLVIFHEIASIFKSFILLLSKTESISLKSIFDSSNNKYSIFTNLHLFLNNTNKKQQKKKQKQKQKQKQQKDDAEEEEEEEEEEADDITETSKNKVSIAYSFIANAVYHLFLVVGGSIAFVMLGVNPLNIFAIFGSLGFAIALGLQGLLSDVSAGLVISMEGNFQINDIIEIDGNIGKVIEVTIFRTTILDFSNRHVHIPNASINKSIFRNYTAENYTITDFTVTISNYYLQNDGKTIDAIIQIIRTAVLQTPHVDVIEKSIQVGISNMNNLGTGFGVYVIYKSNQYPEGEINIKTNIRKALQEHNIWPIDRSYPHPEKASKNGRNEGHISYDYPSYYATSKQNPFLMKMTKK